MRQSLIHRRAAGERSSLSGPKRWRLRLRQLRRRVPLTQNRLNLSLWPRVMLSIEKEQQHLTDKRLRRRLWGRSWEPQFECCLVKVVWKLTDLAGVNIQRIVNEPTQRCRFRSHNYYYYQPSAPYAPSWAISRFSTLSLLLYVLFFPPRCLPTFLTSLSSVLTSPLLSLFVSFASAPVSAPACQYAWLLTSCFILHCLRIGFCLGVCSVKCSQWGLFQCDPD